MPYERLLQLKLCHFLDICLDNYTKCIVRFINIWRIPCNNWSNSQTLGTLGRFAGRATESGRGSTISWILRIRDFLVFILMLPFFKIFSFCFFNVNYWQHFLFKAPLMIALIYVNLKPNVDMVCFQRTKGFLWLWGRVLVKLYLNSCLLPSIVILLAV